MDKRERIIKVIREVSRKDVRPAADESLFDSGMLDSFVLADLLAALEKEFGVKIPDADLNPHKFDSLSQIEEYLASRGA